MMFLGMNVTGCSRLATQEVSKGAFIRSIPLGLMEVAKGDACCASGPQDAGSIGLQDPLELNAKPGLALLVIISQIRV